MIELVPVLIASLVGSLHCVGMCGGLVGFYAGARGGSAPAARWASHAAYHFTRLCAYAGLGASAGQLGAGLDGLGRRWDLAALGALLAATVLISALIPRIVRGRVRARLLTLGRGPERRPRLVAALGGALQSLMQTARQKPPVWRASVLGLSSALLPCGWLYGFVLLAAGAGSPSRGALLLSAFWLGTIPALLGLGVALQKLGAPLRAHLPRFGAALVLGAALVNLVLRWPAFSMDRDAPATHAEPSCHAAR